MFNMCFPTYSGNRPAHISRTGGDQAGLRTSGLKLKIGLVRGAGRFRNHPEIGHSA